MIKTKKNEYLEYLMKIVSNNSWETIYNAKVGFNDNAKEFESFILPFLDCIFKCNLKESDKPTEKAIDLFDYKNGIFVQVSTQSDRSKIEKTLKKLLGRDDLADINSLKFLFIGEYKDLKPNKPKTEIDKRIIELIKNIRTKNPNFDFDLEKDLYFSLQLRKYLNSLEEKELKTLKDKFVNFDKAEKIIKRSNSKYRDVVLDKKYNLDLYSSPETALSKIKSCLNMEGHIELYHQVYSAQIIDKFLEKGINNIKEVIEKLTYWHDIDLPEKFKLRLLEISKSINFKKIKGLIEEANEHLYSGLTDQIAYDNIIAELTKNLIFDDSLSEVREEWDPSIKPLTNNISLKESYDELKRECGIHTNRLGYIIKTYKDDLPKSINVVKAVFIKSEAGMGKTNFLLNICEELKKEDRPFIFILGNKLDMKKDLFIQINKQLGLEASEIYIDNFFDILNEYGESKNIIIPILIDGLNESKSYSTWDKELVKIIDRIDKLSHVKLVVSYRSSYENIIFKNKERGTLFENSMFSQNIYSEIKLEEYSYDYNELISKYIKIYKTEITSGAFHLNNKSLLYIRMFFETYVNQSVVLTNSDILKTFNDYINFVNKEYYKKINPDIVRDRGKPTDNVTEKLLKLGENMWKNRARDYPLDEFLKDIEEEDLFDSDEGVLSYLISNSLISDIDYQNDEEYIHFTYDLFAGYIIAEYIISSKSTTDELKTYLESEEFIENFSDDPSKQHPLYPDIVRCLSILYREKEGKFLHEFIKNDLLFWTSICSLFEIDQKYLSETETTLITVIFSKNDKNKESIMESTMPFWLDPSNKWNFDFFSGLLKEMSMSKRDRIWTEFIRKLQIENQRDYFNFNCEKLICLNCSVEKAHLIAKLCLLTSTTTITDLRYKATKALFKYSLEYPTQFVKLLEFGINFNDPYVNETVVKVAYGMILESKHKEEFINELGVEIANLLYNNYFSKDGKNHTSHIVIREYASNTILIVNSIHEILSSEMIELVKKPYKNYQKFNWQRLDQLDDYEGAKYVNYYEHGVEIKFTGVYMGTEMKYVKDYIKMLLPKDLRNEETSEYKDTYFKITHKSNLIYGWNVYDFGSIDHEIMTNEYNYADWKFKYNHKHDSYGIVQTYGQKYNFIACFEYWGHLLDEGKLCKEGKNDSIYRNRDLCYDPTFPKVTDNINLDLGANFNFKEYYKKWTETFDSRLNQILQLFNQNWKTLNIENNQNDWVLLNGYVLIREDKNFTKGCSYWLNTILVDEVNYTKLKHEEAIETTEFEQLESQLEFEFQSSRFIKEYDILDIIDPDYITKKLKTKNILNFKSGNKGIKNVLDEGDLLKEIEDLYQEKMEYQSLAMCVNLPDDYLLMYFYHWIQYFLPGLNLIRNLKLFFKESHFIMYDKLGVATKYVTIKNEENLISGNLLYIRKDLFENLISDQNNKPILTISGQNTDEGVTKYFSKLIDYSKK